MRFKTVVTFIVGHTQAAVHRSANVWSAINSQQRVASIAAMSLGATMVLPWYEKTTSGVIRGRLQKVHENLTAFQAFSFVEAAVLLVAAGSLLLIWSRGEGRTFKLPLDDGLLIAAGGVWVALLVFYRFLDKPKGLSNSLLDTTVGLQWGIFITLLCGLLLASAGMRSRTHIHQLRTQANRNRHSATSSFQQDHDERFVQPSSAPPMQQPTTALTTEVIKAQLPKPSNRNRAKQTGKKTRNEDQLRFDGEQENG